MSAFEPIDRRTFEIVVKQELSRLSVMAPTLAAVNRARRVILAAADAYRAWMPDADPPTTTEQLLQRIHRRQLQAVVYHARNRDERPSP